MVRKDTGTLIAVGLVALFLFSRKNGGNGLAGGGGGFVDAFSLGGGSGLTAGPASATAGNLMAADEDLGVPSPTVGPAASQGITRAPITVMKPPLGIPTPVSTGGFTGTNFQKTFLETFGRSTQTGQVGVIVDPTKSALQSTVLQGQHFVAPAKTTSAFNLLAAQTQASRVRQLQAISRNRFSGNGDNGGGPSPGGGNSGEAFD